MEEKSKNGKNYKKLKLPCKYINEKGNLIKLKKCSPSLLDISYAIQNPVFPLYGLGDLYKGLDVAITPLREIRRHVFYDFAQKLS